MATTSIHIPGLPDSIQSQLLTTKNLPSLILAHHRSIFHANIATGNARYFLLPHSLLGSTIIPIIYLTIPHKNRPWLYQARWALAAVMIALNVDLMTNGTSSANVVISYCTGLVACWGLIWGLTVLLVLDPQFGAARVVKRRRKTVNEMGDKDVHRDGKVKEVPIDESVATVQDKYEHYWQYYPAEGSFMERLGWVMDLSVALRGVGWNFATSAVPRPRPPPSSAQSPASGEGPPVNLSSTPLTSRIGTTRHKTYLSFTLIRLAQIITGLLIIDLCTLIARRDTYFALGPLYPPSTLPPFLAFLPPQILSVLRSLTSLIALLAGLDMYLCFYQLLSCQLFTLLLPQDSSYCANELWQYPSPFGPFVQNVLDGGLAGFWGGFWHQTFRIGFVAPVIFLDKQGFLSGISKQTKQILGMASAFTLSASIHAAGAYTTIPDTTQISAPFLFFGGSFVGILLEQFVSTYFKQQIRRVPKWVRRTVNLIFVATWMHITGKATFLDDICRAGLFLFEPIPISPLRWLGVMDSGLEGDGNWWRWDHEYLARWVPGRDGRWWEGGFRL